MTENGYFIGNGLFEENILLVTGTCRAGKTLLSKLLASTRNIEWVEEPYTLLLLPVLTGIGYITPDLFSLIFPAVCKELISDHILLRNGNFRANDLSSIWNYKEGSEIFERLVNINSRNEVKKYIKDKNKVFLLDIPEVLPFTNLIRNCCKNVLIIHVVRNGYDVASAVTEKQWFSDNNLKCINQNMPYRSYVQNERKSDIHIPWWIEYGEEESFITASMFERGMMYWSGILGRSVLKNEEQYIPQYDVLVKYEDLVESPDDVLKTLSQYTKIRETTLTNAVKAELNPNYSRTCKRNNINITRKNKDKFEKLMEMYGYE